MPSRWLRKGADKLKKCSERRTDSCSEETDGCCSVIPCEYCLAFAVYGQDDQFGSATFAANAWTGTIAGAAFVAYWERGYTSGECEFVVTLNGFEVYRKSCYEGQSCRDSSDGAEVTIGYDSGTLTWTKRLNRPLEYVVDPYTGCRTWFCGECECSTECLCVLILDGSTPVNGEICDVSYSDCDPPHWQGTVGDYELSIELDRDENGDCVLIAFVNGEEQDPIPVVGCADLSASIELYGVTIELSAKQCFCGDVPIYPCECRLEGPSGGDVEGGLVGPPTDCAVVGIAAGSFQVEPTIAAEIPEAIRMWPDEWTCRYMAVYNYKITAFPPLCVDPDVSRRVVYVKKTTDTYFAPLGAANDTLEIEDWYVVVYTNNADPRALVSINFNYEICCINETPEDPATSHLVYVKFPGTSFGPWAYTMQLLNPATEAIYGTC